ncbi:thermonuclease family protein [Qipengyuania sp. DGS5-3]|uniref:thermonuclease family protein n=1 Tax=Qipengyuania sp. DGS5-3 TaxID=3349632 RepID=UPI0036D23D4B
MKFETKKQAKSRLFPLAMIAVPLGAFSAVFFAPTLGGGPELVQASSLLAPMDTERATFPICKGRSRITCVVDGDTIWYQGTKIRIADINTPEVTRPGCAQEARLGAQATARLQDLLNEGAFTLAASPSGRDTDRYGRSLRVITRDGASLGDVLVDEGLAEEWTGRKREWCR